MRFSSNRMDFEKALADCEEICKALEVLIKPEILETFLSMITEYRLHYSRNIDELFDEIDDLNSACDGRDSYIEILEADVAKHDDQLESLENDKLELRKIIKKMKQE